jgi:predicted lipid-binding transport protein (Tim44 family)
MSVRKALATLAVAGAVCWPLAAQQPRGMQHGGMHPGMGMGQGMGMMDSMMGPMMQAMASTPEHLLARKTSLRLTAEQESRLTALRDAARAEHDAAVAQATVHLREVVETMRVANPDTSVVKHHFQAAMGFMQTAHWAMLRSAAQAWPVLTEAQRRQVTAMADSMRMGGMMMRGEMKHQ